MAATPNKFIVMTSSAHMPNSCWGIYRNVAVVELEPDAAEKAADGWRPAMISKRARGVAGVRHYGPCNVGKTARCAYQVALLEAQNDCRQLNERAGG